MLPLKKDERYTQGVFKPKNKSKFLGEYAVFRSSYERAFFLWADKNPNVLEWSSESVIIPYISPLDNRVHRYYIDAYVALKEGKEIKKYIIEIKPYKQTIPPEPSKRKKKKTILIENQNWAVNNSKWEAARKFAKNKDMEFLILTEKDLF